MTKYQLVQRRSQHELSERVNAMLAEGWKLQGGISVANEANGNYIYVQAMTKETNYEGSKEAHSNTLAL